MGDARSLAQTYRHFAEAAGSTSPLYGQVALALSRSDKALRAIEAAPARRRQPTLILAALHDLALAGRAPALLAAYATADADAAASAAIQTLLEQTDAVAGIAARRRTVSDQTGHGAVLYPAIAHAARQFGATAMGLVDLGCSAGFDLQVDRVGITYSNGQTLGDPTSVVQLTCSVVGDRSIPSHAVPPVVARIGVDRDPLDMTDPDDVRWVRANVRPDQPEQRARLDAELELAANNPPVLLRGDVVDLLPEAIARVPDHALPVVTTSWALSGLSRERRRLFLQRLEEAAAGRALAWVSAEGVGVAPTVPTFGDRPASGHSIIGVALFDNRARSVEAVGRCWSRGRLLAWLA